MTASVTEPPRVSPPIDAIVTLACRAPSVFNTQPWLWRSHANQLELRADCSRQLVHVDPHGRDLVISCGAALHHVQVAAAGLGWSTRVRRMPDPADPRLLARVELNPAGFAGGGQLAAISSRRTDRRRFSSWPVAHDRLLRLATTGSLWGAQVFPVTRDTVRSRLAGLTLRADRLQRADPAYVAEVEAWVRRAGDSSKPGSLPSDDGAVDPFDGWSRRSPRGLLNDPVPGSRSSAGEMLIVCTSSDDPISWLRAGEACSATWLEATEAGMAIVPLSQPLEVEETREQIHVGILGDLAFPQMVLYVGWSVPNRAPLPPVGRRSLGDVLVRD